MHAREGSWRGSRRDMLKGTAKVTAGGVLVAALTRHGFGSALAQATPVTGSAVGYPELKATITDQAVTLSANSVPAGYVLLTVVNQTKDSNGAGVIGPGPGQTMQQMIQEAATPTPQNAFPKFFYTATIAGGPGDVNPGETAQAIIRVAAGDWALFTEGSQPPAFFTATGGTPAAQPAPTATVTVTEQDFAFVGLNKPVPAGKQTWQVVNAGKQPHMLVLLGVPAGTTIEQVMQIVNLPGNATPPPGGLNPSEIQDRGGVILQSAGQTVWTMLDLTAGRYVAACFVTDPNTGKLHAMEGMITLFDVGGAATPGA